MAQPTNTFDSYDARGIREDLQDVIYNVDPEETPFYTASAKLRATNTLHEWQTDALRNSADNAHIEGDELVLVLGWCHVASDGESDVAAWHRSDGALGVGAALEALHRERAGLVHSILLPRGYLRCSRMRQANGARCGVERCCLADAA